MTIQTVWFIASALTIIGLIIAYFRQQKKFIEATAEMAAEIYKEKESYQEQLNEAAGTLREAEKHYEERMAHIECEHKEEIKEVRKDSAKRASSITRGKITENLIPLLKGFNYEAGDCVFMGEKVDYVIFDGLSKTGVCKEIIFYEVKTGGSNLSKREKSIKDCVNTGNVKYVKAIIKNNGEIDAKEVRTNKKRGS